MERQSSAHTETGYWTLVTLQTEGGNRLFNKSWWDTWLCTWQIRYPPYSHVKLMREEKKKKTLNVKAKL